MTESVWGLDALSRLKQVTRETFHDPDIGQDYEKTHFIILIFILLLGTILRFWGLDNVGLHGDEETMAMPALSILDNGMPLLPSGMLYPRALGQLYLMASSVAAFGQTEWALRLPSAIVGSATPLVAFFLGRRFLRPEWNLLFVLVIALLPSLIIASQVARMYIFLVTFVMIFAVAIFRWEARGTWGSLALALAACLIALQFHRLAVFSSFLFLYPVVTRWTTRTLWQGLLGFTTAVIAYYAITNFQGYHYLYNGPVVANLESHATDALDDNPLPAARVWLLAMSFALLAPIFLLGDYIRRKRGLETQAYAFLLFLGAGFVLAFQYHIGGILIAFAALLYLRAQARAWWPGLVLVILALVFIAQSVYLGQQLAPNEGIWKRAIAIELLGSVSIWQYFTFSSFFPVAIVSYFLPLAYAAMGFVRKRRIPNHFLFFIIAVWLPIFIVGYFKWYIPERYVFGIVPLFVLCWLSGFQYLTQAVLRNRVGGYRLFPVAAIVVLFVFISPTEFAQSFNVSYGKFPDHKGAAAYIESLELGDRDILVAEDMLQQTYYLGEIDYWLRAFQDSRLFSYLDEGKLYDIYTSTPVIGTGSELAAIIEDENRGALYIIGSGETAEGKKYNLGDGIWEELEKWNPETVYLGRDNKTRILLIPPIQR